MRLRTFLIEKYGNIERADLSFDPAPGCLNLLLAPNGAGKSVLRRAFHDLLFGIPLQSDMRFRFDYPGMHLRADAVATDGTPFTFGWQRKPGRIFPNANGDPAASRWLAELLAAVTPRQVEQLFALDTERLRSGGRDLASGDGTLGSALLSGTGELASARKLRRSLDERRAAIWERSRSKPPLNAAIAKLGEAAKRERALVQTPRALAAQLAALDAARVRRQAADAANAAAQERDRRLTRIQLTSGPLSVVAEAEAWLAAHPDAPALPADLGDGLSRAKQGLSLAGSRLADARTALEEAQARAAIAERDAKADALETELAQLPGLLGDARTKRRDITARAAERDRALGAVAATLRDMDSAVTPEDAGSVIPALPVIAAAREQIGQYTAITTKLSSARERFAAAEAALEAIQSEAAAAPAAVAEGLETLLADIRRDREPRRHAAELARATRDAAAALSACVARCGWAGDPAALLALAPPAEPVFERADAARTAAAARLAEAAAERDRLAAQRAHWQTALDTMRRKPLPDAQALADARAARDVGLALIYRRAFTGTPDDEGERAFAGDDPLPIAFERRLRAADAVADARIEEIARVEQAAQLATQIETSTSAWDAALAAVAAAERARDEAVRQWAALCVPLHLTPDATLREVREMLAARRDAIDAHQALAVAKNAEESVAAAQAAWAERLAALLGEPGGTLLTLLPLADARIAAAAAAQKAAVAREARRVAAEAEVRTATTLTQSASEALQRWQTEWEGVLAMLARPPGESPVVTEAVLGRVTELDRHCRDAAALAERITGMQTDIAAFERVVRDLAERMDAALLPDVFETADALIARRDRARILASAAVEAERSLADAAAKLQTAETRQREETAALHAVFAAAGAADAEAAEQRIASARTRVQCETVLAQARARLQDVAPGIPLDRLAEDAASLAPGQFDAERTAVDAALERARKEGEAAAVELDQLERQYAADATATGAADAAESQAAIAAEAGRLLDEYLLLRVASGMLGRALERVEQNAGPTGVQRIAAAFESMTGGAWTIRASETAKGETLLLAQEVGVSDAPKHIDQLSEGSRDQLYLALRLVAIEDHVAASPPLPFIADDILQTFDDRRARAAMEALVALSQHVQVIVLTHHPHLLTLAEGLQVHVQRL